VAGQNEILGLGTEQAHVIAGGVVGAGLHLYLRPVGSWMRFIITFALSLAAANVFAHDLRVGARTSVSS
jgi:hypothetical protein